MKSRVENFKESRFCVIDQEPGVTGVMADLIHARSESSSGFAFARVFLDAISRTLNFSGTQIIEAQSQGTLKSRISVKLFSSLTPPPISSPSKFHWASQPKFARVASDCSNELLEMANAGEKRWNTLADGNLSNYMVLTLH